MQDLKIATHSKNKFLVLTPDVMQNNSIVPDGVPAAEVSSTEKLSSSTAKPIIIGIYGPSGAGKSHLLTCLKRELGEKEFDCYDGSAAIESVLPGTLEEFKRMPESEKEHWRQAAMDKVAKDCAETGKIVVITGHYMFWKEGDDEGKVVFTNSDQTHYSHILYLDVPPGVIKQRRQADTDKLVRDRGDVSEAHLEKWTKVEKTQLRDHCYKNGILFSVLSRSHENFLPQAMRLFKDFQHHDETFNYSRAQDKLKEILAADERQLDGMLVFDADRTLAAEDGGKLFWNEFHALHTSKKDDRLKEIFDGGYFYTAFRQVVLLHEECSDDEEYEMLCQDVAAKITMYPAVKSLLERAVTHPHVSAVVVTCGLRRVWEIVLEKKGLSKKIKVIGSGRIIDGFIVTAAVKQAVVTHLKEQGMCVWAFGDSVVDIDMLVEADHGIVVVGQEDKRSKTIDVPLKAAIQNGLRACQALLPETVSPRLDTTVLPVVDLANPQFINSVFSLHVMDATKFNISKLLMTPMRNANIAGPALRESFVFLSRKYSRLKLTECS